MGRREGHAMGQKGGRLGTGGDDARVLRARWGGESSQGAEDGVMRGKRRDVASSLLPARMSCRWPLPWAKLTALPPRGAEAVPVPVRHAEPPAMVPDPAGAPHAGTAGLGSGWEVFARLPRGLTQLRPHAPPHELCGAKPCCSQAACGARLRSRHCAVQGAPGPMWRSPTPVRAPAAAGGCLSPQGSSAPIPNHPVLCHGAVPPPGWSGAEQWLPEQARGWAGAAGAARM